MAVMEINSTGLEVLDRGRGELVVLVHGSASDHRTWSRQIEEFARDHRVVAYSRRYHWPNAPIPDGADYSMHEHVDDLQALLRALDPGPVHLVGHSYGAFVCLLLAIRDPGRVRTLALTEPPLLTLFTSNDPGPGELIRLLLTRPRTALEIAKFGVRGIRPATAAARRGDAAAAMRSFGKVVLGQRTYERMSDERRAQVDANTIAAEFLGSGFAPLTDADVRGVQVPALLLGGTRSPAFFARVLDRLEELLPDCERARIAGASHIVHEDEPRVYNDTVLEFLGRHRPI